MLNENKPILLLSSTSWTKDEDFSILFSAMEKYDGFAQSDIKNKYPKLYLVITGKGPEKIKYENLIKLR